MKIEIGSPLPDEVRQLLQRHLTKNEVFSIDGITHNVANNLRYSEDLLITEKRRACVKEMLKAVMKKIRSSERDKVRIENYINQLN